MLLRKYDKSGKYKFVLALKNNEFDLFLNKFYGSLISKGKKSLALKLFNKIIFNFKKKINKDPFIELHSAFNNILPLLSSTQKKLGKTFQAVPSLAKGNRRFVIMIDWILRKQKGKSNIQGLNMNDVSRHLIDANKSKGFIINLKQQFYRSALSGKHLLYYRKKSKISLKGLRRNLYKQKKYKFIKKEIEKHRVHFDEVIKKRQ